MWLSLMCMYARPEVGGLCKALVLQLPPAYLSLVSFASHYTQYDELSSLLMAVWHFLVVC